MSLWMKCKLHRKVGRARAWVLPWHSLRLLTAGLEEAGWQCKETENRLFVKGCGPFHNRHVTEPQLSVQSPCVWTPCLLCLLCWGDPPTPGICYVGGFARGSMVQS